MNGSSMLLLYAALSAISIFLAVFALLRLRRQNDELREAIEYLKEKQSKANYYASEINDENA